MKKLIAILLSLVMVLSLASCTAVGPNVNDTTSPREEVSSAAVADTTGPSPDTSEIEVTTGAGVEEPPQDSYKIGNTSLVYAFTEEDAARIDEKLTRAEKLIAEGNAYDEFKELYDDISDNELYYILSQRSIAYIYYCLHLTNDEMSKEYLYIESVYTSVSKRGTGMYQLIYDSPFREAFYDGWTEDEINEALALAGMYTEEYVELSNANNRLVVDFRALEADVFFERSAEMFATLIKNHDRMAEIAGYDDYMSFAYDNIYGRDYTVSDAQEFGMYVAEYIVPLFVEVYNSLMADISSMSQRDYMILTSFLDMNYEDAGLDAYYKEFAEAVGGDFLEAYNKLWDGGNYFFAYDQALSYDGAFTTYIYDDSSGAVYFGPRYQSIMTIVHEFGHYYAATVCGDEGSQSIDLAEAQSQGDEWLFLSRIDQVGGDKAGRLIVEYQLFEALAIIVQSTIVNEFEIYAYAHSELTPSDFDEVYKEICEKFGGYETISKIFGYAPEMYWHYVVIDSPAYYISYAVSLIPALELYIVADEDFSAGAEKYKQICNYDFENGVFLDVLQGAGLSDPFDAAVYKTIAETFGNMFFAKSAAE